MVQKKRLSLNWNFELPLVIYCNSWVKFDPRSVLSTQAVEKATQKKFRLERDSNPWPYEWVNCEFVIYPMIVKDMNMNIWKSYKWSAVHTIDHLSMLLGSSVDSSYIHIHIFHYHRVYHEFTIDHLSMWLGSSVDRPLHRYRKVMGQIPFKPEFFQPLELEDTASIKFHSCFISSSHIWCLYIYIHIFHYHRVSNFTHVSSAACDFHISNSYLSLSSDISRTHNWPSIHVAW